MMEGESLPDFCTESYHQTQADAIGEQ